ncbi:fumarylacetoacetate hydrolase family protein [Desmospora profundinema]|uniref:2-keto-4-pentenoate hydratase/2-oxohepta-3-ene-1,7-dioic acid hydratase in catechol pathway n=1 Tax=Desmospora profundinema TaxID=1571184 RepID=A0ABU1ITY6_9BACL|nr:fumarylacetoacetate hydrolase family protein [Desmospora profundinema]MDR6227384.1 2-keto-4-pentenoate hydratase/2-oxohepta-3-ene-1,7-dioic acid hydratase in catechol pathway [Desmospora profundinema]
MKLVTYQIGPLNANVHQSEEHLHRLGWLTDGNILDIARAWKWAKTEKKWRVEGPPPHSMLELLDREEDGLYQLRRIWEVVRAEDWSSIQVEGEPLAIAAGEARLLAPLPVPRTFRDFYAFEAHVKTARARRGLDMVPEWYQFPVFYFSHPYTLLGPEDPVPVPATRALDYELEIAFIIGKKGRDIPTEKAMDHIAGVCVLNDWSARDLQREEMKVGLGPAKGKDFATSLGPALVTLDELEDRREGDRWNLEMTARVNGRQLSKGNVRDLTFSFGDMVERASRDCLLRPGELVGSGTVGTGCILELGEETHRWLKAGDIVELEIERLGVLRNRIVPGNNHLTE